VEAAMTPLKEVRDSMMTDNSETELGQAADFVDDAIDDDEYQSSGTAVARS
jgi:hypothetical protein